ncbi:MAG: tRNA (adenosine(37)-N6)-dimethylallyltransferase MiaA [Gammaproteobacteria bacterium]|nr:tRNA (adenosine(37)-N6)-dimethylallyltransferase MiaA [Gammaproteobacteria bacterium]
MDPVGHGHTGPVLPARPVNGAINRDQRIVCVMGPTASGKTSLALDIVRSFPCDIISVDSAQVYRGMDIGTAKPDQQILKQAPHRLIDICDPSESYSAARFRTDALAEISKIHARGRIPLLVGGTMLYFRALLEGISRLPEANPATRREIEAEAARYGWKQMHERLSELDPVAAAKIDPGDPQRIQRALEVIRLSGRPLSQLQAENKPEPSDLNALKIIVCPAVRALLHRRIERRFNQMLEEGFLDEVRALKRRSDLHGRLPAMRAVGYRQAWAYLEGDMDSTQWQQKAVAATRQLAKRQLTWLRREKSALWYDPETEDAEEKVFAAVRNFLPRA